MIKNSDILEVLRDKRNEDNIVDKFNRIIFDETERKSTIMERRHHANSINKGQTKKEYDW